MTGTRDWRTERWAATHHRIYAAALGLFQEHGFDAVSVGRIAREAGVSVPTFYAHYPSREHVVMHMASADDFASFLAEFPTDGPVGARIRAAVPMWVTQWSPEFLEDALIRWRIVATTPSLRTCAARFERTTGQVVADVMPVTPGAPTRASDAIVINAYLSAFTAALLAWADGDGERKLEELVAEAFDALEQT